MHQPNGAVVLTNSAHGADDIGFHLINPGAEVVAGDLSEAALDLAAENARANGVSVRYMAGDLFGALPFDLAGRIDLFVANPPYVSTQEMHELPDEVAGWEPEMALAGGDDGLDLVRRIAVELPSWLAPGGWFFIEVGSSHAAVGAGLFPVEFETKVRRDMTGRDRYLVGRKP